MDIQKPGNEPATYREARPLSGEEMAKMFDLVKKSTSVELKITVPDEIRRRTVEKMGFDPVEAEPRQAFFFDTADLALNKAGLVVRARRIQGGSGDTVVKLRPVDPSTVDPDLGRSAAFKIELDAMPGGFVCSGSLKGVCTGEEVLEVCDGAMPLSKIFSKEQRAFYKANAPEGIPMDSLIPLGPTFLLKARHLPKSFDRRVTIELWLYPDGSRILELSTKAEPNESYQVAANFKAYLAEIGVPLSESQETKTKSALEFFSKVMKAKAAMSQSTGDAAA